MLVKLETHKHIKSMSKTEYDYKRNEVLKKILKIETED